MERAATELEFAEFFASSWAPCLRAVVAVTGSEEMAEDQVAEAFARALASWRKLRGHPAPRAWVVRTALNVGTTWFRRRRREVPLGDLDVSVPGPETARVDAVLLAALRGLPGRQREVVVLRVFLDLDIETTAIQLGIAAGTVRAHLARAVATLRTELSGFESMEARK